MLAIVTSLLGQAGSKTGSIWTIAWVILGLIVLTIALVLLQFFRLWLQAYMSNADVGMFDLIGMRLRK
ncbi:MAG: hypothetical protein AAB363_07200, partial [Planctomycetota bacterium]